MKRVIKLRFLIWMAFFFPSFLLVSSQPVIDIPGKLCYNQSYHLRINQSYSSCEWQYGYPVDEWQPNSAFDLFIHDINMEILSGPCPGDLSCSKITTQIRNTNFNVLNDYYDLFKNLTDENKSSIANIMLKSIIDQNKSTLSKYEIEYLKFNFLSAIMVQTIWERPNLIIPTVKEWFSLGASNSSTEFLFTPEGKINQSTSTLKVWFRVNADNVYSNIKIVDILPKPPTYSVDATLSCPNSSTGKISLLNISDVNDSLLAIVKKDGTVRNNYIFVGKEQYTLTDNYEIGTYSISLLYHNSAISGCSDTPHPITINQEKALNFTITPKNISCPGTQDGQLNVNLSSFAKNYEIFVNGLQYTTSDQDSEIINKLNSGTYKVQLRDFCKTSPETEYTIGSQNTVTATSIKADPKCFSVADGSISLSSSGSSTSSYNYQLYNSNGFVSSANSQPSSYSFTNLPGGDYTVKVSSDICSYTSSTSQNLTAVQPISYTFSKKDPLCFGQNTGEINVTASGGSGSYVYSIDDNPYSSTSKFTGLIAGNHFVKVHSESMSCNDQVSSKITLNSPLELQFNLTAIDISCYKAGDGTISSDVKGGTAPYIYDWDSNLDGWNSEQKDINYLNPGTYWLNITDYNKCTAKSDPVTIIEPAKLRITSVIPIDAACIGDNGKLSIITEGGNGGNNYIGYTDEGIQFDGTDQDLSVPPGEYYVRVKDRLGCENTYGNDDMDFVVTVTKPETQVDFTYSLSDYSGFNIRCKDESSGQITVSAYGGNGPGYLGYLYSVSGSPEQSTNILNNISAGLHTIKVTDDRGCSVEKSVDLTSPEALTLNTVFTKHVTCYGDNTGEINVAAGGGIENTYSFKLDGEEMLSGIFRNLYADIYTIEAIDKNECSTVINTEVQNLHPAIQAVLIPQDIRCFGENNGNIEAYVSGGSGDLTLTWQKKSGESWQDFIGNGTTQNNLGPGIYRIKATDDENCYAYNNTEIVEPGKLIINDVTVNDVVCFGEKGSLDVHISGGVGGTIFDFIEKEGAVYESNISKTDLPPGIYHAAIRDKNGCEASYQDLLTINAPESPIDFISEISSYNGFSVSCNGSSNGLITVNPSGGNGNAYSGYTYSLAGSDNQTNNVFNNLTAGSYNVRVTDGRGCSLEKTVFMNEPAPVSLSLLHTIPVKCFGDATGEIAVETTGGITNIYKYKLDGKDAGSTGIFKNLAANTHLIEVTDLNGCKEDMQASVVHKNLPVQTEFIPTDVRCYGENNGKILSETTGGAGSYTFAWEKKDDMLWQRYEGDQPSLNNLYKGHYRIRVTDLDNCSYFDSIEIKEPEPLTISNVKIKDAVCYADSGSFVIGASGGNGGYFFFRRENNESSFQPYAQDQLLFPGSYMLKASDSKGCETEKSGVIITKPDRPLDLTYQIKDYNGFNVSCHGNIDGMITVIPSGGNDYGYEGYTYRLSGRSVQNDPVVNGLEAGDYGITLTDDRGCTITRQVSLKEPPSEIQLRASILKNPLCVYDTDGRIGLLASGGTSPYTYSIDSNGFVASTEFTNLPVKRYNFKVRDVNGCVESIDTALISTIRGMDLSGTISDVKCNGENSGSIDVLVSGGAQPFRYRWSDNVSLGSAASNLKKGTYTVFVTDSADCKAEKTFLIKEPESPLSLTVSSFPACVALQNGSLKSIAIGGTPPYRFAGDNGQFTLNSNFDVFAGKHTVYLADYNDCKAEIKAEVGERNKMPDINFMLATSRYELDTLVVIDVSVPAPDRVTWEFSPEAMLIDSSTFHAKIRYEQSGVYPVKMTGYFGSCIYTIEKLLNIAPFDPLVISEDKNHKGIKNMSISPNPNSGSFEMKVELYTKQSINVKVFDYYSRQIFDKKYPADIKFDEMIGLPDDTMPGTYMLWIIAEDDARSSVLIISR
jgi:hypothetical protein